jgi:DNA-binding CsgD family transcriptional regulator
MSLRIASDHPTLSLKNKIQEVCDEFMKNHGFNYFQYLRCYHDGSIGLLTNNTGLLEYFQHVDNSPVVFSSYTEDHQTSSSYWFLWDEELPQMPVQLAREKFNIRNGITLVKRSKYYYDMIAVATPVEPANAGAFYMNKLKVMEHYFKEFEIANHDLIQLMNKSPLLLPESYRDTNYKELCLSQGTIPVKGTMGETYVTTQELSCLRLLIHGKSYKEIAQILEISPRTVETYLQRVKHRTGLNPHHELEFMNL